MCAVYCNPLLLTNREEMYAEYSKEYGRGLYLGGGVGGGGITIGC
jgi:hypothetical protein